MEASMSEAYLLKRIDKSNGKTYRGKPRKENVWLDMPLNFLKTLFLHLQVDSRNIIPRIQSPAYELQSHTAF